MLLLAVGGAGVEEEGGKGKKGRDRDQVGAERRFEFSS